MSGTEPSWPQPGPSHRCQPFLASKAPFLLLGTVDSEAARLFLLLRLSLGFWMQAGCYSALKLFQLPAPAPCVPPGHTWAGKSMLWWLVPQLWFHIYLHVPGVWPVTGWRCNDFGSPVEVNYGLLGVKRSEVLFPAQSWIIFVAQSGFQ